MRIYSPDESNDKHTAPHSSALCQRVPLLDVGRGNAPLHAEYMEAISKIIETGAFLHGPDVKALEAEIASRVGVPHAISCASGSDAILLALMAVDVGPGDEVIVPSFTFFATAAAVWRLGAKPVFVDIDPHTFNIDPALIEPAITPATKAVIPVHLFGQVAAMTPIMEIARRHGLVVIEDMAQAIDARYGVHAAGAMGDIGCISFYPTKNLGGFGDGGMMTARDARLADRLRLLAGHGMRPRYYHREVGINSRLDSIQAAILRVKLRHLESWTTARRLNAERYAKLFRAARLDLDIQLPSEFPKRHHVWNQYTVRVKAERRDSVRDYLTKNNVGAEIYYPVPLHVQDCFRSLGYRQGDLPHTERAAAEVLSLPIFPELTEAEQATVVGRLAEAMTPQIRRVA
jgi:dTDP-4-amino-4,6-dideoxygalactose transaminase